MSEVVGSAMTSLHGFIAGPRHEMQWLTKHLDDIGAPLVEANTDSVDDPVAGTDAERAFGGEYSGPSFALVRD